MLIKIIRESPSNFPKSKISSLLFALCKGDTNEWVLEKCCELAVENVIIWQAEHSVAKVKSSEDINKKLIRWNKICESASKQSGNPNTTKAHFAKNLAAALESSKEICGRGHIQVCCSTAPDTSGIKELAPGPGGFSLIIGPEGDFSKSEIALMKYVNTHFITLGPYILRAETAAISAIAAMNNIFGYKS